MTGQIDPNIQKLISDELDSLTIMLNDMGPSVTGTVAFLVTDDKGYINTQHTTNADDEVSRANMAIGLMDIAAKILNRQENTA
jgi:hypothetical protein